MGVIFGAAHPGHRLDLGEDLVGLWWTWGERQLVLFLILFLFYSAYFMLRFSIDPGPRRERNSAVYALFGVVLIPVSFLAIRLAGTTPSTRRLHARRAEDAGRDVLHVLRLPRRRCSRWRRTLYRVELAGKRIDASLRELRELLA